MSHAIRKPVIGITKTRISLHVVIQSLISFIVWSGSFLLTACTNSEHFCQWVQLQTREGLTTFNHFKVYTLENLGGVQTLGLVPPPPLDPTMHFFPLFKISRFKLIRPGLKTGFAGKWFIIILLFNLQCIFHVP